MTINTEFSFYNGFIKSAGYFDDLPKEYHSLYETVNNNSSHQITVNLLAEYCNDILKVLKEDIGKDESDINTPMKKFLAFSYIHYISEMYKHNKAIICNGVIKSSQQKSKIKKNKVIEVTNFNEPIYIPCAITVASKDAEINQLEESICCTVPVILCKTDDVEKYNGVWNDGIEYMEIQDLQVKRSNASSTTIYARFNNEKRTLFKKWKIAKTPLTIFTLPQKQALNFSKFAITGLVKKKEIINKIFPTTKSSTISCNGVLKLDLNLDQKQEQAVLAISQQVSSTFVLIGPPGTGKTSTLVAAIKMLRQKKSNKILVCTPTNRAADVFAEQLLGVLDPKMIFRLISRSQDVTKINPKLNDITMKSAIKIDGVKSEVFDWPTEDDFKKFKIVICTLGLVPIMAQKYKLNAYEGYFNYIFIDEAGQSPEMECWLPLHFLANENTRLILAGDPKQLGPVTNVGCLQIYGYKKSLLARLSENSHFIEGQNLVQLKNNYRSDEAIVNLFSGIFYNNTVCHTYKRNKQSLCNICSNKEFPIIFEDISGEEELSEANSYRNIAEGNMVVKYVTCLKRIGINDEDIGIISPYKYQGRYIRRELNKLHKNSQIIVDTVEKFQGMEKRVIIMTTVRTSKLGFMAEDNRLNTGISRAKELLIIIGDKNTLVSSAWKKLEKDDVFELAQYVANFDRVGAARWSERNENWKILMDILTQHVESTANATKGWNCAHCTFENTEPSNECAMCGLPAA